MNSEQQTQGCFTAISGFLILGFVFVGGWLQYGDFGAALWLASLWIVLSLASLIGLIPVAGPFLYWKVAMTSVLPAILNASGITTSWLTTLILSLGLAGSIYWTICGIGIVLALVAALWQTASEAA
jgi:hypothetical protein